MCSRHYEASLLEELNHTNSFSTSDTMDHLPSRGPDYPSDPHSKGTENCATPAGFDRVRQEYRGQKEGPAAKKPFGKQIKLRREVGDKRDWSTSEMRPSETANLEGKVSPAAASHHPEHRA